MRQKWAVLCKPPDDHPGAVRLMGLFWNRSAAEELCGDIRAAVDLDTLDETSGYAYVIEIERPSKRRGIAWATRGEWL